MRTTTLLVALASLAVFVWTLRPAAAQLAPKEPVLVATTPCGKTKISSLPFTINNCGSYVVTKCLKGVAGQNGITINTDDVTLDLCGFTLTGVPGSLDGVQVTGNRRNVKIRNGFVRDWGGSGIAAGGARNGVYSDLSVSDNGQLGLSVGSDSSVSNCTALENGFTGINGGVGVTFQNCSSQHNGDRGFDSNTGSTYVNCAAAFNDGNGIVASGGSAFIDCATYNNGLNGFETGSSSTVRGCTARGNGDNGFIIEGDSTAVGCSSEGNGGNGMIAFLFGNTITGCTVAFNEGDGIQVETDCHIANNTVSFNGSGAGGGDGIVVVSIFFGAPTNNRIDGNHVTGNQGVGVNVPFAGNLIVRNTASDNGTDYLFALLNDVGPIGSAAGSTSPFANIQF